MAAYWAEALDPPPARLPLPTEQSPPGQEHVAGRGHIFTMPEGVTSKIKAFAKANKTTPYTVILAGLYTLLYRYTQQREIAVGTPVFGRSTSKFRRVVGDFVNTVVMQANIEPDISFQDHLARVKESTERSLAHQDYPFGLLVEQIAPHRNNADNPLIQTLLVFQRIPSRMADVMALMSGRSDLVIDFAGIEMRGSDIHWFHRPGEIDLNFDLIDFETTIRGILRYNTDLFTPEIAEQLATHLVEILSFGCAKPDTILNHFPLLSTEEEERLLVTWNQTAVPLL